MKLTSLFFTAALLLSASLVLASQEKSCSDTVDQSISSNTDAPVAVELGSNELFLTAENNGGTFYVKSGGKVLCYFPSLGVEPVFKENLKSFGSNLKKVPFNDIKDKIKDSNLKEEDTYCYEACGSSSLSQPNIFHFILPRYAEGTDTADVFFTVYVVD